MKDKNLRPIKAALQTNRKPAASACILASFLPIFFSGDQASNQEAAGLAIAVFRHQLIAGIGAMAACLGGVDAIALTGGIGQNDQALAGELSQALGWLQPFELHQIPADEEGLMARQCQKAASPAPS